jgi:soluble lytic murein transglycosylase
MCSARSVAQSLRSRAILLVVVTACTGARPPADPLGRTRDPSEKTKTRATSAGSWRDAARAHDWRLLAERIDALPAEQRLHPVARYARAVAGERLGDCPVVLRMLEGLADMVPPFGEEAARLEAQCQLEIGPFPAAAAYYERVGSLQADLNAAVAWQRSGELDRSRELAERVLSNPRLAPRMRVRARSLRAKLAEQLGLRALAIEEYRWLAVEAALPAVDLAYERLSRRRMTKHERVRRARVLARRGDMARVLAELALAKSAPGKSPGIAMMLRTEALAQYRARADDPRAAALFERAAQRSSSLEDLFSAARAWSRAGEVERARGVYERILQRHPGGASGERASFALSRLLFAHGRWAAAEVAYTTYLRRFGRLRRARHADEATFERALSRLATGRFAAARDGFGSLRLKGSARYPRNLLRHLEAVALVSSRDDERRGRGVALLQSVVREAPLSFAALASSARLRAMGRLAPELPGDLPQAAARDDLDLDLSGKPRLFADLGLHGAAERALHAQERELRRRHEPRGAEVLCRSYAAIGAGARRLAVGASLSQRLLRTAPDADNLWAWQCLYPRPYARVVEELEARHDLPEGLVHAVMRQESGFRPEARSTAGAMGLMQLMPATAVRAAAELELVHEPDRLTQVRYNLELGTFYLGKLLADFNRRPALALAAYNAGPHAVARWLRAGGGDLPIDLWVAHIPFRETRNYVMRVLANFARYRYLTRESIPPLTLEAPETIELAGNSY